MNSETADSASQGARFVIAWGLRIFFNFIAFFGVALILYELIATMSGSRWSSLEEIATFLSAFFTLVGTFLTVGSVYFFSPEKATPPEKLSVYILAPIILCGCIIAFLYLFIVGQIPAQVINGFALLALAGALLRIQPHPVKDANLFYRRT